ncbi:PEP-CTERM sorting domain-containing protein [Nostoc sp. CCCryo 231-06]|nr:PEP-CTERM sorting domain-containing protein [Nostoc sp. CCCryo 231-06]
MKLTQKLGIASAGLVLGCAGVGLPSAAQAATFLFDGTGTPEAVGWQLWSSEPPNSTITVTPQFTGRPSDVLSVSTTGTAIHLYSRKIDATNYIISMGVKVLRSSFNSFDYGLGLSPFAVDRVNSLTIGEKSIQWSDLVGDSFAIDTSIFHEYAISYIDGNLNVYVDNSFDDIIAGTATPVLTRTGVTPQDESVIGTVAFGDQSNDSMSFGNCCVNSAYKLDFIRFQSLDNVTSVPEPSTNLALAFFGFAGLLINKKLASSRRR